MKQISRIFILIFVVIALCSPFIREASASSLYSDVSKYDWYSEAIYELTRLEVISGTGNGRFEPKNTVTKAQAAAFLVKAFQLKVDGDVHGSFFDVSQDSWYFPYVESSVSAGLFSRGERYFSPDSPIRRAELVDLLLKATNIKVDRSATSHFRDISGHEFEQQINTAFQLHITNGVTESEFAPESYVTRAEFASFLYRNHIFAKVVATSHDAPEEVAIEKIEATTTQISFLAKELTLKFFLNGQEQSVQELKKAGYIVQFVASTDVFQSALGTKSTTGILSERKLKTILQAPISERYFYYQVLITKGDVTLQSNVRKVEVVDHHRLAKEISDYRVQRGSDIIINSEVLITGEVYQIIDIHGVLMNDLQVNDLPHYVDYVEFYSSDANIVLVSSRGEIVPLSEGNVTITVVSGSASYSRNFQVKATKRMPALLDAQIETLSLSVSEGKRTIPLTLLDQYGDPMYFVDPTEVFSVETFGMPNVTVMLDEYTDVNGEFHLMISPNDSSLGDGLIEISFKNQAHVAMKIAFTVTNDLEPTSWKLQIVSKEKQLDRHNNNSLALRLLGFNDSGAYVGDVPLNDVSVVSSSTELVQVMKSDEEIIVSLGTNESMTGSAIVSVWKDSHKLAQLEVDVIDSKPRIHQIDFGDISMTPLFNEPLLLDGEIIKAFIVNNGRAISYEWEQNDTLLVKSGEDEIATIKLISNVLNENGQESVAHFHVDKNGHIYLQHASTADGRFQVGDIGEIYILVFPIRETEVAFMKIVPVHIM